MADNIVPWKTVGSLIVGTILPLSLYSQRGAKQMCQLISKKIVRGIIYWVVIYQTLHKHCCLLSWQDSWEVWVTTSISQEPRIRSSFSWPNSCCVLELVLKRRSVWLPSYFLRNSGLVDLVCGLFWEGLCATSFHFILHQLSQTLPLALRTNSKWQWPWSWTAIGLPEPDSSRVLCLWLMPALTCLSKVWSPGEMYFPGIHRNTETGRRRCWQSSVWLHRPNDAAAETARGRPEHCPPKEREAEEVSETQCATGSRWAHDTKGLDDLCVVYQSLSHHEAALMTVFLRF